MSSGWRLVLIQCRHEPKILPVLLALLRVAICFWPQTGYLHPDEFFQSPEISAQRYFNSKIEPTWEFTNDKPIRCMLLPTILNHIAFRIATILQNKPNAYLLVVAPRLVYTLFSFVIDFSLYKLCQYYSSRGLWYLPVSIIFQTSFVCLSCLTRTLSNVPEVVLFSLLLVVVSQLIRPRFRILFVTPTRSTPVNERVKSTTQLSSSLLIGFIMAFGLFNRPTFCCFALVPLLYWFAESLRRNSYDTRLMTKLVLIPVATAVLVTSAAIVCYDTVYYRGIETLAKAIDHLVKFEFNKLHGLIRSEFVFTLYNFWNYNTNPKNLVKFGLHAPYVHMLINIPLAFNVLGLMFYGKLINLMVGSGVYRLLFSTHRIYALMLLTSLTSTILLSFIPHQEFRFLLPLIVPLVYAFAFSIYSSNRWLVIWLLVNFTLLVFYGSVHQSGVMRAVLDLDSLMKPQIERQLNDSNTTSIDVMAFRCYLAPSYQWNVHDDDERFRFELQDTFADFTGSVQKKLLDNIDECLADSGSDRLYLRKIVYIMLPNLYLNQLKESLGKSALYNESDLKLLNKYSLHFSGEEFWDSIKHLKDFGISSWREAFGFVLMQLDLNCRKGDKFVEET